MLPKVIAVDLDGVLNTYQGNYTKGDLHQPRPGAREFLSAIKGAGFSVVVHSVRDAQEIREWLTKHSLIDLVADVTSVKPLAHVYLDDRAICFEGVFTTSLVQQIIDFRPHWEMFVTVKEVSAQIGTGTPVTKTGTI